MVALALFVFLDLIPNGYVYAQANQSRETINNLTNETSNSAGIMKNTSGMLDDAFDALKDAFGSFFGK